MSSLSHRDLTRFLPSSVSSYSRSMPTETPVRVTGRTATSSAIAAVTMASSRLGPSEMMTGTLGSLIHPEGAHHVGAEGARVRPTFFARSEEHTSELQSRLDLVCRLLLEVKNV